MITEQFVFHFTFKSGILYETRVEDRDVEDNGTADGPANGVVNGAVNGAANGVSNGAVNSTFNGAAISIITTENSTGEARIPDVVAKQDHHLTQMSGLSHIQQEGQLAARSIILLVALSMDCIFEGIRMSFELKSRDNPSFYPPPPNNPPLTSRTYDSSFVSMVNSSS